MVALDRYVGWAYLYTVIIIAFAVGAATVIVQIPRFRADLTETSSRFGHIDGLRGLLAIGVVIHHSFTGYIFRTTGQWDWSHSNLLNQLGQSTVAMFFMVTSFLFTLKAMRPVNWGMLYFARLRRLCPLYFAVIFIMLIFVAKVSHWELLEPWKVVAEEVGIWLSFVVLGRPDINAVPMTWTLIAGVNWTLKFEILFYVFGIPLMYVLLRAFQIRRLTIVATLCFIGLLSWRYMANKGGGSTLYLSHFLAGAIVALAVKVEKCQKIISTRRFSISALTSLIVLLSLPDAYTPLATICTTIIFASVAVNGSLFGVLRLRGTLWLGDVSYGIYLIHGLTLYAALGYLDRFGLIGTISFISYLAITIVLTVTVIIAASFSYSFFERPLTKKRLLVSS